MVLHGVLPLKYQIRVVKFISFNKKNIKNLFKYKDSSGRRKSSNKALKSKLRRVIRKRIHENSMKLNHKAKYSFSGSRCPLFRWSFKTNFRRMYVSLIFTRTSEEGSKIEGFI